MGSPFNSATAWAGGELWAIMLARLVFVTLAMAMFGACGWQEKVVFVAEHRGDRIVIYQPFPINEAGIKVVLERGGASTILFEQRGDTFLGFADVCWNDDQTRVGVYIVGAGNSSYGYDISAGKRVPFETLRHWVAQDIRKRYKLPADVRTDDEVFAWSKGPEASRQFLIHYPRAKAL
jgi:hypothetical protein